MDAMINSDKPSQDRELNENGLELGLGDGKSERCCKRMGGGEH